MSNILFNVFKICVVCFIVLSSCSGTEARRRAKRFIEYGPDIAGPYCATRRDGCCPGRIDECSVPILDTLCYCDRFCNRTRSDCCPDYFSFCLGQVETTPAPLRGIPFECQTDWIQIRPNILSDLIWVQRLSADDTQKNGGSPPLTQLFKALSDGAVTTEIGRAINLDMCYRRKEITPVGDDRAIWNQEPAFMALNICGSDGVRLVYQRGGCLHRGRPYPPNSRIKINCQECTCAPDANSKTGHSFRCSGEICLVRENVYNSVNDGRYGWRASNYSMFWGMTLEDGMRYRLGTHKPDAEVERMNPIKIKSSGRLPDTFDARIRWPGLVTEIRDQGNCAASWAFSTTALSADRLAIESRGAFDEDLSPQHLLSCNVRGQDGCTGGSLDRAWWFLRKRGVTTEKCYPYLSGKNKNTDRCGVSRTQTRGTCPSGIPFRYESIYQATPPYRLSANENDIMAEIYNNGPVQASFKVKEDFFMYKSGVYSYSQVVPDKMPGDERRHYHSVRIIGWGTERRNGRNLKYWLCANSWGRNWGENGYFKIARGVNECDIESFVLGVWGKVEGDLELRALLTQFRRERQRQQFGELRRRTSRIYRRRQNWRSQ